MPQQNSNIALNLIKKMKLNQYTHIYLIGVGGIGMRY